MAGSIKKDTRDPKVIIATRAALELKNGDVVNLGIGLPVLVGNNLPEGVEIVLQSENGMMGLGPAPVHGHEDVDFTNAGGGLVNITVLARRMRRLSKILDAISPIEYLEKRFESTGVKVIAAIIGLFGLSMYILAQFLSTGQTLVSLFGFDLRIGLTIGVAVILIYTFVGGYFAVAYNDMIQGIIMITATISIFFLALNKVGGLSGLNTKLAEINPTYLSIWGKDLQYQNAWGVIAGAVLIYLIGYMGLPHCVNKHMALNSPKDAKATVVYATFWNQLFIFPPYIVGIMGIVIYGEGLGSQQAERIIPDLAQQLLPGIVAAIVLCAIMAAIMSTVAALLLLTGTILSIDVYKRWLRPAATDKQVVMVSRLMILFVTIVGLIIAIIRPPGVFALVIFAFGTLAAGLLPSYVCAVYWKKANAIGSMVSMVVGSVTDIVWTAANLEGPTKMHPFFMGLILASLAMFICSQFGKPTSDEMKDNIERAKGKARVSPKIEGVMSKTLVNEGRAVSEHLVAKDYLAQRGFNMA